MHAPGGMEKAEYRRTVRDARDFAGQSFVKKGKTAFPPMATQRGGADTQQCASLPFQRMHALPLSPIDLQARTQKHQQRKELWQQQKGSVCVRMGKRNMHAAGEIDVVGITTVAAAVVVAVILLVCKPCA